MKSENISAVRLRIGFNLAMATLFGYMTIEATSFPSVAGYFPLAVGAVGVIVAVSLLLRDAVVVRNASHGAVDESSPADISQASLREVAEGAVEVRVPDAPVVPEEDEEGVSAFLRGFRYAALILAYVMGVWLVDFYIATFVFIAASIRFGASRDWKVWLLPAVGVIVVLFALANGLGLAFPEQLWAR